MRSGENAKWIWAGGINNTAFYVRLIAQHLNLSMSHITVVIELLDDGNTVPFVYRSFQSTPCLNITNTSAAEIYISLGGAGVLFRIAGVLVMG